MAISMCWTCSAGVFGGLDGKSVEAIDAAAKVIVPRVNSATTDAALRAVLMGPPLPFRVHSELEM
jgi:hypothetical protein